MSVLPRSTMRATFPVQSTHPTARFHPGSLNWRINETGMSSSIAGAAAERESPRRRFLTPASGVLHLQDDMMGWTAAGHPQEKP
jgi:hypothetical protein